MYIYMFFNRYGSKLNWMFIHLCCTPFVGGYPCTFPCCCFPHSSSPPSSSSVLRNHHFLQSSAGRRNERKEEKEKRETERAKGNDIIHFPCPQKSFPCVPICGPNLFVEKGGGVCEWVRREKTNFRLSPFAIGGANHLEKEVRVNFPGLLLRYKKEGGPSRGKSVSVLAEDIHIIAVCV